jgi:hypothetical protein
MPTGKVQSLSEPSQPIFFETSPSSTQSAFGVSFSQTVLFSKDTNLKTGLVFTKPRVLSSQVLATGAFQANAKNTLTQFNSLESAYWLSSGLLKTNLQLKLTSYETQRDLSLIDLPKHFNVADVSARLQFKSANERNIVDAKLGRSYVPGRENITFSLPTTINEAGDISFTRYAVPLNTLYDVNYFSLGQTSRVAHHTHLSVVASGFGYTSEAITKHWYVGLGLERSF